MPLSEHEQRLFDQIEQSLAKDPKFASAVRATDPRTHTRRRVVFAVFIAVAGFVVLIGGAVAKLPLISVAGFVVALGGIIFGAQALRQARGGTSLKAVGGTATRQTKVRRMSFIDRLEGRWRSRPEGR